MKTATRADIHQLNQADPASFNGIDFSGAGVSSTNYPNHHFYNCIFADDDDNDKNRLLSDLENQIQETDHNKNSNARMNVEHHLFSDDKEIREYALQIYTMRRKEHKENAFFVFVSIVFIVVLIRVLFFPF